MPKTKQISNLLDPIMSDPERKYRVLLGVQAGKVSQALGRMLKEAHERGGDTEPQTQYLEDLYLKTLREHIEMLGGELEINAVFPDLTVRLKLAGDEETSKTMVPGFDDSLMQEHASDD